MLSTKIVKRGGKRLTKIGPEDIQPLVLILFCSISGDNKKPFGSSTSWQDEPIYSTFECRCHAEL